MGRQKKNEITIDKEYDVPFLTPYNIDYVKILNVKVKNIDGKDEQFYTTQIYNM